MYDRYRSRSRDGGGSRRRSPRWRDDGDREYYRSRKADHSRSPPRSPLLGPTSQARHDDPDMYRGRPRDVDDRNEHVYQHQHQHHYQHDRHYDRPRNDRDHDPDARRWGGRGRPDHRPGDDGLWYDEPPREAGTSPHGPPSRSHRHDHRDGPDASPHSRSRSRPRGSAWTSSDSRGRGARSRSRDSRPDAGSGRLGYNRDRSRDRARPPRRRHATSTLILENLPGDITEKDILLGLDHAAGDSRMSTDQIRFVRVRSNKRGGRIAFVEFRHLYDASDFFDYFHPSFPLTLVHSRGVDSEPATVNVDYSRPRDDMDRPEDANWECSECGVSNYPHRNACFKCKVERLEDWRTSGYDNFRATSPTGMILTGETDECPQQIPSQFIVVRDLESSVTEEVLAKGVMKLFVESDPAPAEGSKPTANKLKSTAPTNSTAGLGASPGSLRRIFLTRDRRSNESWRYGFAEFATVEDARAAVAKYNASPKFTIASKPVAVAFIHTGVFVPAFDASGIPEASDFTFAPIYNPNLRVKYWDDRAYPSVSIISAEPALPATDPAQGGATDKNPATPSKSGVASQEGKKSKKEKDLIASKKALAMTPQMQMWAKKAAELHRNSSLARNGTIDNASVGGLPAPPTPSSKQTPSVGPFPLVFDVSDSTDLVLPHWSDQYVSYADWDSQECLTCERLFTEEWLVHHEINAHNLYKDDSVREKAAKLLAARGKEPRTVVRRSPRRKCDPLPLYTSYADQEALVCYVCGRKLDSVKLLRRHERESELHKRNLARPGRVDEATAALEKAGWKPIRMFPLGFDGPIRAQQNQGPQYRDRARERRSVYNQPKKPSAPTGAATTTTTDGRRNENTAATAAEPEEATAKKSKGAGLLAKMGWTAGEGLGAQGEGRTQAINTELYAPGVGLGAEGSRLGDAAEEAARKTRNNFSDFVEKTKDKARERFEKLD